MANFINQTALLKKLDKTLRSKKYFLGNRNVLEFEKHLKDLFGVKYALAMSSGTAAIHCALAAAGVTKGDEVLVPAISVVMSVSPIIYLGATPVFVDCQFDRIDFNYDDLISKITPRTKAILPVYMWGHAYDIKKLQTIAATHNLTLIEDACQAMGSKWQGRYLGTWGDVGCFSLKDGKIITSGEGGFLLTNKPEIAELAALLRNHYFDPQFEGVYERIGFNYRLSEIQALLANHQLRYFHQMLSDRQSQTDYLVRSLADLRTLKPMTSDEAAQNNGFNPVWLISGEVTYGHEKDVLKRLAQQGVINSVGSFGLCPVYERPCLSHYQQKATFRICPHARQLLHRVLAPVILPNYSRTKLRNISSIIRKVLNQ